MSLGPRERYKTSRNTLLDVVESTSFYCECPPQSDSHETVSVAAGSNTSTSDTKTRFQKLFRWIEPALVAEGSKDSPVRVVSDWIESITMITRAKFM